MSTPTYRGIIYSTHDDVRCAAMAATIVNTEGIDGLVTTNLNAFTMGDLAPYKNMITRGIKELGNYLTATGVR